MTKGNPSDAPLNEPERDPWFDPSLSAATARGHKVVIPIVTAVEQFKRERALRANDKFTYYRVLIPLVANLIHHYLTKSRGQGIPVPRSNKALGRKRNRYQPFSFPRSFPKMLDALNALGFAEVTIGKYSGIPGQSKLTTIKAGEKLIALIKEHNVTLEDLSTGDEGEIIILKRPKRGHWDEGERIDYTDTPTTIRFRTEFESHQFLARKSRH